MKVVISAVNNAHFLPFAYRFEEVCYSIAQNTILTNSSAARFYFGVVTSDSYMNFFCAPFYITIGDQSNANYNRYTN